MNSLLFTAETWSGVREADLVRLEQVDLALVKSLASGHSKCPNEFPYLEMGVLKLRHILTTNRMMYHHHLLQTHQKETIRKIYDKMKEDKTSGDWFQLLLKDFEFLGETIDEENIKMMPKEAYKKKINKLVRAAAFRDLIIQKEKHSKLNDLTYTQLKIQPYLSSKLFNNKERKLLFSLRSRCYLSKMNFKKMYKYDLKCIFGCNSDEDQRHIFTQCESIVAETNTQYTLYNNIFCSDVNKLKEAASIFLKIDTNRQDLKDKILPGEHSTARTCAHLFV